MKNAETILIPLALFAISCAEAKTGDELGHSSDVDDESCDPTLDGDGDGLDDCTEEELGLDPTSDDTDGDGIVDGMEMDCGSSPLDATEACYECGWGRHNPGNIQSTGSDYGDVMDNISLVDQCGEMVDIYDFAGEYHILYMTAAF